MSANEITVSVRLEPGTPVYRAEDTARAWARSQGLEAVRMEVHSGGLVTVVARADNTGTNGVGK